MAWFQAQGVVFQHLHFVNNANIRREVPRCHLHSAGGMLCGVTKTTLVPDPQIARYRVDQLAPRLNCQNL